MLIALVYIFTALIFYPQLYFFKDKIEYKNFQVYYDTKIPDSIYPILDEVDSLISQSECYDPHLKFKIFLRSDTDKYTLFPFQFSDRGSGQAIPLIKNIFLYKSDCVTNTSYNHLGHTRVLSSVLAHELIHVLIENKWLLGSKMAYFDKNSWSSFGALWKEEGYAEYIAGSPPIELDEGLKILNGHATPKYEPHFEYFKYLLAVRHLILKKHMSFEEILLTQLNLDDVLNEANRTEMGE
jgi:hypothetical protein